MKKHSTLIILALFFNLFYANYSYSQWNEYRQNFEQQPTDTNLIDVTIDSLSSKIWHIGKPQKTKFNKANTIPFALVTDTINPYDTSIVSSVILSLAVSKNFWGNFVAIRWAQKLDLQPSYDYVEVGVSIDSGKTWYDAFNQGSNSLIYNFYGFDQSNAWLNPATNRGGFTGTDTTWSDMWLCLWLSHSGSWINVDSLMIKFTLYSDSVQTNHEGILLDNFVVNETFVHTVESELKQENSIVVFPTETSGMLNIESTYKGQNNSINEVMIFNANSELLASYKPFRKRVSVDLSTYPDGMYIIRSRTANKISSQKVFLKR